MAHVSLRLLAFAAVVALAPAIGSCAHASGGGSGGAAPASSSTGSTGSTTGGSSGGAPLQPPVGVWLKGDLHVHTTHSGDATQYGDDVTTVIKCCERAGLDFTTISDHRNGDCLRDPQFTGASTPLVLLPGCEWGGAGHAGAHGLTRDPIFYSQAGATTAETLINTQAVIDDVHSMGGIFVLNHAVDDRCPWLWPVDRFDAVEVFNQPWSMRNVHDMTPADLQRWIGQRGMGGQTGVMPPPELGAAVAVSGGGMNWQRLHLFEAYLSSGHHIAAVGGSDSHFLVLPGNPTTQVFAAARTRDAVLDAIRKGHTQVMRAADAPRLEFTADRDGDGVFETIVGDSIPIGRPVTFQVHVAGALGGKIDLVKNGVVVQQWPVTAPDFTATYTDTATARSWYRVNCWEKIDLSVAQGDTLRQMVLGTTGPGWLGTILGLMGALGSFGGRVQDIIDEGGLAAVWLLVFGDRMGVKMSPVPTRYPRLEFPKAVSQILNVAIHDPDYCPGVLTSPIWVE